MAKGYSARNGFGGSAGMMRQQQQMQQKLARMQQDMEAAQKNVEESPTPWTRRMWRCSRTW